MTDHTDTTAALAQAIAVIRDARRTIICSPELESRVKCYIDARGLGGIYTVRVSRYVPDDKILVVNEAFLEASRG